MSTGARILLALCTIPAIAGVALWLALRVPDAKGADSVNSATQWRKLCNTRESCEVQQ